MMGITAETATVCTMMSYCIAHVLRHQLLDIYYAERPNSSVTKSGGIKARKLMEMIRRAVDLPDELQNLSEVDMRSEIFRGVMNNLAGRYWQMLVAAEIFLVQTVPQGKGFPFELEDSGTELQSTNVPWWSGMNIPGIGGDDWVRTHHLTGAGPVPIVTGATYRISSPPNPSRAWRTSP